MGDRRRKSLLMGLNYVGSQNQLEGCHQDVQNVAEWLSYRNYGNDQRSQVILRDDRHTDPRGPYWPNGHNMLAAMDWLVSEPNCTLVMHYSGHGSQAEDQSGTSESGFIDTICPVDFAERGMINADMLHQHLVTQMAPGCTLFVILDCCHSGSALELPFVYRSDADGNINMMDNLKQGVALAGEAAYLLESGFSFNKLGEAAQLYGGARDFFKGLQHSYNHHNNGDQPPGLAAGDYGGRHGGEGKWVTMLSGCTDEQTSSDATIAGSHQGAMSWAFLECMKRVQYPQYESTLQMTRQLLDQSHYKQIPQLSVGVQFDLKQPLMI